jgi:flavin-dependent dehydrogenase
VYDVIIVGARVAGSPLAMLLARAGLEVLVVDRATFPSDTRSTHNLIAPGCRMLEHWGLLDRLAATGCPPISRMVMYADGRTIVAPVSPGADGEITYAPRRHILDHLVGEAAAEAGARVTQGTAFVDVLRGGGRVTGVHLRTPAGTLVSKSARVVVGADGRYSRVAKLVGAAARVRKVNNAGSYAYWPWERTDVEVHARPDGKGEVVVFPTHRGQACVVAACREVDAPKFRADPRGAYMAHLGACPTLSLPDDAAEGRSRLHACGDLHGCVREAAGSGWALVGDAGIFNDPTPGRGISDAFIQAQLLADALAPVLLSGASDKTVDAALAEYAARRDEWFVGLFEATCDMAQHDWDERAAFMGRMRYQQLATAELGRLSALRLPAEATAALP